ncbi:MAG: ATP-binding protein, partial [Spirulina sp. DLM2.Bin59]
MAALSLRTVQYQAAGLLIYQDVLNHPVGETFFVLLEALQAGHGVACLRAYGAWFQALATTGQNWSGFLKAQILNADNPFSQAAQRLPLEEIAPGIVAAAQADLNALQGLCDCDAEQIAQWVKTVCKPATPPIPWQGNPDPGSLWDDLTDWGEAIAPLASYYQRQGVGIWGRYRAVRWHGGELVGVAHPDPVRLADLVGYEQPKAQLVANTEFLLNGSPALHVLLYGSRGSGKSSVVKALLNEYGDRGLRLIEVAKMELQALPMIVAQLRDLPQKFIIFVDDLSFEEDDEAFKALKVVLEGSITARPANVVVYATSNRRHLVREFFGDRPRPQDGDEVQAWDTVQEKLSFSDRFGLTLTFGPADQDTYLAIVRHLAQGDRIEIPDLEARAKQWATRHNGRSGRSARQFIDHLRATLGLGKPDTKKTRELGSPVSLERGG